jgi:NosR/NirI family nitrous oxide reductase transcriptional regulator
MKKIEQIVLLITCLAIIMVSAMQRDGRVWGHDLATIGKADTTAVDTVVTMTTLDDGTTVINTTTLGKDILGYVGPVPLEIHLKDGKISQVKPLKNNETPEFFDEAKAMLSQWDGQTVEEALAKQADVVSGATLSSNAIIGNVHAGLQYVSDNAAKPSANIMGGLSTKTIVGLIVVLMAAIIPLFYRNKTYRTVQLALNVVVLGLWCGTFISWSLLVGYMSSGINLWVSLIPIVMLVTAFVYPLFGRKNYYCVNICPFGSIQDLAGKTNRRKRKLGDKAVKYLTFFRQALFAVLMVLMLTGVGFEWMDYEVFSAFIFQAATTVVIVMAVTFVLLAVFVPRPYCRFVCPTGTLIKLAEGSK